MILGWPAMAVLGFLALAGLVIALGRCSTARYEYERNSVAGPPQQVAVAAAVPSAAGAVTVGAPALDGPRQPAGPPASDGRLRQGTAVGVAAHPAGKRIVDADAVPAWWLVDECGDEPGAWIVAGPFDDRLEAEWAVLATGLSPSTRAAYGVQQAGGQLVRRQSPQERAWIAELDAQLDRLPADWDELLSDTDVLTTLAVEVGAALLDAGLPLHDPAEREDGAAQAGGVCLTPDVGSGGILISWRQHDRMSLQQVRGAAMDAAVQRTMNAAVADVLVQMGFLVESVGSGSCYRVSSGTTHLG